MNGRVSVVITTFNNLPYLRLCLSNLRKYSHPDTEMLIHVDGSTDGTREWLTAEGIAFIWEAHQGIYHGFNEAISRSSGEYIALFADDMVASPSWDVNLLKHAKTDRALAPRLVEPLSGSMPPIKDFGRTWDTFDEEGFLTYAKQISADELVKWGTVASNFFSRKLFEESGGFDEAYSPYGFGDTDLMFRFKVLHPEMEFMYCQNSILYHFRAKSKEQFSAKQKKEINDRTNAHFCKKWGATLPEMHKRLGMMPIRGVVILPDIVKELLELQPDLAPDRKVEYPWTIQKMQPMTKVLDVGCNGSIISKYLLNHGFDVTAADVDPSSQYYWNGEARDGFALVDCRHPPKHWENEFDYILVISTLEHLEGDDDVIMVNNLAKCLKVGGRMFITGPYGDGWMEIGDHTERGYNEKNLTRLNRGHDLILVSTALFTKEEMGWPWKDILCMEFERI